MKLVARLPVAAQFFEIYDVSSEEMLKIVPEEEGEDSAAGACKRSECKIYIDETLPIGHYIDTLLHELAHAWFYASGAYGLIEAMAGKDGDADALEERAIRMIVPAFIQLAKSAGLMKEKPTWRARRRKSETDVEVTLIGAKRRKK